MKKSIAIDMDGVIADVEQHFLNWYHRDYGTLLQRATWPAKTMIPYSREPA
nr:hypothetical protein [uncultured Mucilaginibacter sp.]